jgi:methylase of polypeptide subunit release factors/Fe-S-cluster containining protein
MGDSVHFPESYNLMNANQTNTSDMETAKVELSGPDWRLSTTVSVPKGPIGVPELLPLAQILTDKVVDYTSKSVEEDGKKISCKKGCGACCRQLVPVPEVEARHIRDLVNAMPEPRQSEIRRRFAEARRRLAEAGLLEKLLQREQWREDEVQPLGVQYFLQGIPCPFLEEESCSIHPDRPITCREYLVTSPAENCARPSSKNIAQVELPFKIWPALARLEKAASSSRFVRWVPLILAPEWADAHPAEPSTRPGTELVREFFGHVSATKVKPTEQAQTQSNQVFSLSSASDTEDLGRSDDPALQVRSAGGSQVFSTVDDSMHQDLPLRLGDVKDFARVETTLRMASFDEPTICRMFKIQDMSDIGSIDREKADLSGLLGLILRLFFFMESTPCLEVERWLEPELLESLVRLNLVCKRRFGSKSRNIIEAYYSPVWLYPVAGCLVASDRRTNPDSSEFIPMPDIVFPAIYEGTLRFLNAVSNCPADTALDLCTGSGIAALVLSRTAKRVVACDITARACHFAEFNALLNRCSNVETAQGDLYETVRNQKFDLIVAHPPHVPSVAQAMIYRDSGETGETLIRRILAGLPDYLCSGGSFVSVCGGWDSSEGTFEERALNWIGNRKDEFCLSFTHEKDLSVEETAAQLSKLNDSQKNIASADWLRILRRAGLQRRVYGTLIIHRA